MKFGSISQNLPLKPKYHKLKLLLSLIEEKHVNINSMVKDKFVFTKIIKN